MENIWYRDLSHFMNYNNFTKIIPAKDMTYVEQLNAFMRFSIYFSFILYFVRHNILVWYFAVFIGFVTVFMFEFYSNNKKLQKELYNKVNMMYDKEKDKFCSKPTKDNPFMNPLINEIVEFPNRPQACDLDNSVVKETAEKYFEKNLYKDVDDIWSRKTSSRNWYSIPSAQFPNDRESFQEWLYKTGPTCKEKGGGKQCYNNLWQPYNV